MHEMYKIVTPMTAVAILTLILAAGCSPAPDRRDERLAEFARESQREQSKQNRAMAEQSKAVVEESTKVAEAARELIAEDAEARREMIEANRQLTSELNTERSNIDRQRDELNTERREIAGQRNRDPIVAETIKFIGVLLACLSPLALAGYLLYVFSRKPDSSDAAVSELLIGEITSERPRLLSSPERIEQAPPPENLPGSSSEDESSGNAPL